MITKVFGETPVAAQLCPPQIPYGIASPVRSQGGRAGTIAWLRRITVDSVLCVAVNYTPKQDHTNYGGHIMNSAIRLHGGLPPMVLP
jgi:hypothetical protein